MNNPGLLREQKRERFFFIALTAPAIVLVGVSPMAPVLWILSQSFLTLTGEATPVEKGVGDTVYSGTLNLWGSIEFKVMRLPSESTLHRIIRLIQTAQKLKAPSERFTDRFGTGYTYLQDYLPHVAQAVVREGWIDMVGLGRMVLSYPELPADTLRGGTTDRKKICRTFSDCTTAPRNNMPSGCYPLDAYYKQRPEAEELRQVKQELR